MSLTTSRGQVFALSFTNTIPRNVYAKHCIAYLASVSELLLLRLFPTQSNMSITSINYFLAWKIHNNHCDIHIGIEG